MIRPLLAACSTLLLCSLLLGAHDAVIQRSPHAAESRKPHDAPTRQPHEVVSHSKPQKSGKHTTALHAKSPKVPKH